MPIPTSDNPVVQAAIALLHYHNTNEILPERTDRATRDLFDTLVTAGYAVRPQNIGWYGGPVLKGHPYLSKLLAAATSRRDEAKKDAESYAKRATKMSEEVATLNALLLELAEINDSK